MINQENLIQRFYNNLWNKFDKSQIPNLLKKDFKFRGTFGHVTNGYNDFSKAVDFVKNFSPDQKITILDIISENNKSFAKIKFSGTHKGKIFDINATNKKFSYIGCAIFTFEDNLIKELWVLGDIYNLLNQLK